MATHGEQAKQQLVNGLSVDVEDWFQVGAFETSIDRRDWETIPTRVEGNVDAILDLFAETGVNATFFTLGWIAERHPALVRRIADAGHEIASHGYDHARVFTFNRARFAADITKARAILEDASGQKVIGYRAPSFSIDARTPWAFEELARQGYTYSSSVAPVAHDH
ncbi:MAG: polysaccharide deacetylase family protein, partial [Pseudomonadota bacterium]